MQSQFFLKKSIFSDNRAACSPEFFCPKEEKTPPIIENLTFPAFIVPKQQDEILWQEYSLETAPKTNFKTVRKKTPLPL